jgi:signal transduction histidine kinase
LIGKALASVHLRPSEVKNGDPDLCGAADYFYRADGSVFPVGIEEARLTLPSEAVPNARAVTNGMVDARILNFNDLSSFIRLQKQNRQLERIHAAANMAKEIAQQIRTPLTGISCAIQLLRFDLTSEIEKKPIEEREELYRQIVEESIRMDKVIQNFLNYAEFSSQDVRDLIQMDIDQKVSRDSQIGKKD